MKIVKGATYMFDRDPALPRNGERIHYSGQFVKIINPPTAKDPSWSDVMSTKTGIYFQAHTRELSLGVPKLETATVTTNNRDVSWQEGDEVEIVQRFDLGASATGYSAVAYLVKHSNGDHRFYFQDELIFD